MPADAVDRARRRAVGTATLALLVLSLAGGPDPLAASDAATEPPVAVIPSGVIDGWQVSVASVSSPHAASVVVQRAGRRHAAGRAAIETRAGPWRIVSHLEGDHFRTLQVRDLPGGGSEGFESTWRPQQPSTSRLREAVPAGARILGAIASDDGPRRGETLVAEIPLDAIGARALSAQAFGRVGFVPMAITGSPSSRDTRASLGWQTAEGTSSVMFFRRGQDEVALTLSPGRQPGTTSWVAHRVGALR